MTSVSTLVLAAHHLSYIKKGDLSKRDHKPAEKKTESTVNVIPVSAPINQKMFAVLTKDLKPPAQQAVRTRG